LPSPPNEQRKVDVGRTISEINEILGGWVRTYYQVGRIVLASFAMPAIVTPQPLSPLADLAPGAVCPLDRVAIVRGSDSEARQDGGFYAERKNGIHGAVDLNSSLGEPVYAVANGKVRVAARCDGRVVPLARNRDSGYRQSTPGGQVRRAGGSTTTSGHLNAFDFDISGEALRSATDFCVGGGSPG
jgi:hypothetical protein